MNNVDRDYTKYIDYMNRVDTIFGIDDTFECTHADITTIGFDKSYYKQFYDVFEYPINHCCLWRLFDKVAKMIFVDFNITLDDVFEELKYILPNFIYYLKKYNLNTVDDLRNNIMKLIDERLDMEQRRVNYFNDHKNYLDYLLSTPEDFDFSNVICEIKENHFTKIYLSETEKKSIKVYDAAIPRLRTILISMYSDYEFIYKCCKMWHEKHYSKIYPRFSPEYLKHMIFSDMIEEYNNLYDNGLIDFELCGMYRIIDFFSKKLDVYMNN